MYAGVPIATPVAVRRGAAAGVVDRPSDTEVGDHRAPAVGDSRMLSGLMSRWITPREWANARACATSLAPSGRARPPWAPARRLAPSVSPSTNAMTKYTRPSRSSTVKIGTMFGMRQLGSCLRFLEEPRPDLGPVRQLRREQLHRHHALQTKILRAGRRCPSHRARSPARRRTPGQGHLLDTGLQFLCRQIRKRWDRHSLPSVARNDVLPERRRAQPCSR